MQSHLPAKETLTFQESSAYEIKLVVPASFFKNNPLFCRHIMYFQFRENTKIPKNSFSDHQQNKCLELLKISRNIIVYLIHLYNILYFKELCNRHHQCFVPNQCASFEKSLGYLRHLIYKYIIATNVFRDMADQVSKIFFMMSGNIFN